MTPLIITIVVLLLATSALLFIPWGSAGQADRDALNRNFYQDRLAELEQDGAGVSAEERAQTIAELQQTLLHDIPEAPDAPVQPLSRLVLVPAALLLVAVSVGVYLKTSSVQRVQQWRQVVEQTPGLMQRVMDPQAKPLTTEELTRLGLGLRTRLQDDPGNVQAWQMLGRIGMVLNNATTATQAFERAWTLAPDSIETKLDYAEVLTRSADPQDNQLGGDILRQALRADHTNIRALSLLAFSAFEQQRWQEAIGAWQIMLRLLPDNDSRRAVIERSIAQAKAEAGIDNVKRTVTISLSPAAQKALPGNAIIFVSVTDGVSSVPVAVKKLPSGHFPLSLTLDDADAMMSGRPLSSVQQGVVKVHISRDGTPAPKPGDWFGESKPISFQGRQPVQVEVSRQQP
jgi:cytochrome c-type biogenesis protein CcmI